MTQTTERRRLAEPPVGLLPTLACLGYVGEVGESYVKEGSLFITTPISITPLDAGRKKKVWIQSMPCFFDPEYNPSELENMEKGAFYLRRYAEQIKGRYRENKKTGELVPAGKLSALAAFAGSTGNFRELQDHLVGLFEEERGQIEPEDLTRVLSAFYIDGSPKSPFIYTLRQGRKATGEVDEDTGKNIYALTDDYEVSSYAYFDKRAVDYCKKQEAKNSKTYRITWDPDREAVL